MVQLHYDKDELWLIARKGKGIKVAKENSGNRSRSLKNNVVYSKFKASQDPYKNPTNSKHVLTKITGGAIDSKAMKSHFEYITRNNEIPLFNEFGEQVTLKNAVADTDIEMNSIKMKEGSRKTYQIVFSRKEETDPVLLQKIVRETLQAEFPDTKFYYACHQDTNNTHVHAVLLRQSKQKKKFEIRKEKLTQLKKTFAETQQKHGLEAVFLSETDKQKQRTFGKNFEKDTPKREDKRKGANEYKVLDFGKAPYEFEADGKPSFYLCVETKNGEKKFHWSWGLQAELQQKSVRIGDKITLKKVRSLDMEQKTEQGKFQKSMWKIDVLEQSQGLSMEQFKVVDFGKAPYKFDEVGKPSYYIIVQNHQGLNKDYWGKALEIMIKSNNIKVGDTVIRNQADLKEFVKVETATQQVTQPLEQEKRSGFKI